MHEGKQNSFDYGSTLAIGVSLGFLFGLLLGNAALGLAGGLMLAALANVYNEAKQDAPRADTALIIAIGGLLLFALLVLLSGLGWY